MALYVVSNAQELNAAVAGASSGDRIELRGGEYGDFALQNVSFGSDVVIAAHDANDPPVFNKVALWNVDHLAFDGIKIDFQPDTNTVEWSSAFLAQQSSHISLRNAVVEGGPAVAGVPADSAPGTQGSQGIMGEPIGIGVRAVSSDHITVENTDISYFTHGTKVSRADGVVFVGNDVHDVRRVPLVTADADNVLIEDNYFHDMVPWKFGALGDHGDFIHIYTLYDQTTPDENITIRGNYMAQGTGEGVLGIYMDDKNSGQGFVNVTIEDNVIHNDNFQGMSLENIQGGVIRDNTLLQPAGGLAADTPHIRILNGSRDIVVDNNIAGGISGTSLANLSGNNITLGDNLIVQSQSAMAENYTGELFPNALATLPARAELQPLWGSAAEGYGADYTWESNLAVIKDAQGSGLALSEHTFDVQTMAADGMIGLPAGSQVIWDFGDGTQGQGGQTTHVYEQAGLYIASAEVTTPAGDTYTVNRTIEVQTPLALSVNFDTGITDLSDLPIDANTVGTVQLANTDDGQAVRLVGDRSAIAFDLSREMLENPEFTISVAFRKDAGSENDWGSILNFSGTASITVERDGITVRGTTSEGESVVLQGLNAGVADTDWHHVTYTYSQTTGEAVLYLDGAEIDRQTDLTGLQHTTNGHGLHVGNPWGKNLDGLIDDVSFVRAALDAEEVADYIATGSLQSGSGSSPQGVSPNISDMFPQEEREALLNVDFADGGIDSSSHASQTTVHGREADVFVQGLEGEGFHLNGKSDFEIDASNAQLRNLDNFEFSFDFRKDEADGTGVVMRQHTILDLQVVRDGMLLLRLHTDEGFYQIATGEGVINDTEWHTIKLRFDDDSNELAIEVNGEVEASGRASGRTGDLPYWGVVMGNPWGESIEARVDNLLVTTEAYTDDDPADEFNPIAFDSALAG